MKCKIVNNPVKETVRNSLSSINRVENSFEIRPVKILPINYSIGSITSESIGYVISTPASGSELIPRVRPIASVQFRSLDETKPPIVINRPSLQIVNRRFNPRLGPPLFHPSARFSRMKRNTVAHFFSAPGFSLWSFDRGNFVPRENFPPR